MSHLDPERLILLALDDGDGDREAADHLATCELCRSDLASMRELALVSAETQEVRDLPPPPPSVWAGIQAQVEAIDGGDELAARRATRGEPATRRRRPRTPTRLWLTHVVTAVAAAAVAVAGTLAVAGDPAPPADPGYRVVSQVDLGRLPNAPDGFAGYARLLDDGGERRLHIHVTGLPQATDRSYAVWLLDQTSTGKRREDLRMAPIGAIGGKTDEIYPIPADTDLSNYRIVDISVEPNDGDERHSGNSVLRGVLNL